MQMAWLEDLVELARTRSFTRAAENRFVTHPAFGRRIRALEAWVGAALVERTQPVSLTPAGQLFLDAATVTLDVLSTARAQLQHGVAGTNTLQPLQPLRIATGRTLARTFLPDWYAAIDRRFGPFSLAVSTGGAREAIQLLANGEVDLLVTYSSPATRLLIDPQRYESLPLSQEVLLPVSAPDQRGLPKFPLLAGSTAPIPWLAFATSLTLRGVLAKHLAALPNRLPLLLVYQADSYDAILEMAKRGAGLAWLPKRLLQDELKQGRLLVVGDASLRVSFDISLCRLRSNGDAHVNAIWHGLRADPSTDEHR